MSKILIISSGHTGQGHESIRKSLQVQMELSENIQIDSVDGFTLGNWFFRAVSMLYDPIAVKFPALWDLCYKFTDIMSRQINVIVSRIINKKFLRCIEQNKPDIIVSVHPAFVGSVLNILEHENLEIPLVPLIADLDNVSSLWADKRATYILCPTEEAKTRMLKLGIDENQLKVVGFPVRKDFCDLCLPAPPDYARMKEKGISVLMVNGSQGNNKVNKIAKSLLKFESCRLSIVAGNNAELKKSLESLLGDDERVKIHGFVNDMAGFMAQADILIIRASPNVMMEAVNLCKPIIIVGSLSGQEKKNPDFAIKNALAINCTNVNNLPLILTDLLNDGGELLNTIYQGQTKFRRPQASKEMAEFITDIAKNKTSKPEKRMGKPNKSRANKRIIYSNDCD